MTLPSQTRLPHRTIKLTSDRVWLQLQAGRELRATALGDADTGSVQTCVGPELEVELDVAEQRLGITGWRGMDGEAGRPAPNAESGYRAGWQRPEFDDAHWYPMLNPTLLMGRGGPQYYWARAHVFVPADCAGKPLTLVVGGIGRYDYRWMRAFVNGRAVGTRRYRGLWHEPLRVQLGPEVRAGQDNLVAIQMTEPVRRTARLDALDPQQARALPHTFLIPPQFEQYIAVGADRRRAALRVSRVHGATVDLRSPELAAEVRYRFVSGGAVLIKQVTLRNVTRRPLRILQVGLGRYATDMHMADGDQGFPVYAAKEFFFGLAHPAGWAMGNGKAVELRQYPGVTLAPGATWRSMEAVYGAGSRSEFLRYVRSRMRRVRRGHDKAMAIYESFASWPIKPGENLSDQCSEAILLRQIKQVARAQRVMGERFDIVNVEFWLYTKGDVRRAAPDRFPNQFRNVRQALEKVGPSLGLWIDSSVSAWNIGGNPVVSGCSTGDAAYQPPLTSWGPCLCRASEPFRSMMADGFQHHLNENKARLFKFDNLQAICYNPRHVHLPGLYSTEAIVNSVIAFLGELDRTCPEVFLMLYWGHRSPWWLLHGDTLFEPGLCVEASHPSATPTLYARDGVTLGLDQAQWFCEDVPALGKDSLGVWLSDWPWNSMIGKARWQSGFVMDMCRGSLLAQPWGDLGQLSAAELREMGTFIGLLRAHGACFSNPKFIGGNPWKDEPYGYVCSDGSRGFIALHNCTWTDHTFALPVTPGHSLFRWYPTPARLTGDPSRITLRPFDVVLLESSATPALGAKLPTARIPVQFAEASRPLALRQRGTGFRCLVSGELPASRDGGMLVISADRMREGTAFQTGTPGRDLTASIRVGGRSVRAQPVLQAQTAPTSWQAWRVPVSAAREPRRFEAQITVAVLPEGVRVQCAAYWLPQE